MTDAERAGGSSSGGLGAEAIVRAALKLPAGDRLDFVAELCRGDRSLERAVAERLAAEEAGSAVDRLAAEIARHRPSAAEDETEVAVASEGVAADLALVAGSHLGRYEIRGHLGTGGMGEVFRAHDPLLERPVAIKVIRRRIRHDPEMLARFAHEARAASALNHPNIVTVYDLGEHEGHPFLVMELVEGESLAHQLDRRLSSDELVRLATQIADALSAAHEAGIVHRDLKPGNILIDRRNNARLLDFGVAVIQPGIEGTSMGGGGREAPTRASSSTSQGVAGTVGYMAPEAVRGETIDHRADQFALGVVLYELAVGRKPFGRGVAGGSGGPSSRISELRADLPPALGEIIARCLADRPERRFSATSEIVAALEAIAAPPPSQRSRRRGSLPTPATPLHGRREEIQELRRLLLEAGARLVTLTGLGGSGKTRLAIEVAREMEAEFTGGVVFVSLGTIREAELVVPAIAAALGGFEAGGGAGLPDLLAALAESDGGILLLLDNFEQVIDAASEIGALLEGCPDLTILVTSRELLHLRAERDFPVRPLGVPARGSLPLASVQKAPAVELFVERAQAANPAFRLDASNVSEVVELCRRLDGLPLALELAAARVRTLPLAAILQRLQDRMALLTGGPRDLPARQRTLRATLDWSHELLDPLEQAAFRGLGAFAGSFTLEAAEAVLDPFGNLDREVVDLVESLHDQSLLVRVEGPAHEARFTMLETIRDYAAALLGAGEDEAATRKAYAAYFLVLAEEGEAAVSAGKSERWLERFQLEEVNFRAALDWLVEQGEVEWALRTALGLFRFWEMGESVSEGHRRLEQLLALPAAQGDSDLRARALFASGVLAGNLGDRALAMARHEECLAIYRRLGDPRGQAVALNTLGIVYTEQGLYEQAQECYEESLELWEKLAESDSAARSLSNFGFLLRSQGKLERSREVYRQAAEMFERLGDQVSAAWELSHEADVARDQQDADAAELYRRALERFRELDDPWGTASMLADLAGISQETGELEVAHARYREALRIFLRVGHQRGVLRVLESLATLAGDLGDDLLALRLAGAAHALSDRLGSRHQDPEIQGALQRTVARARQRLDPEAADEAWQRGESVPIEHLVEERGAA